MDSLTRLKKFASKTVTAADSDSSIQVIQALGKLLQKSEYNPTMLVSTLLPVVFPHIRSLQPPTAGSSKMPPPHVVKTIVMCFEALSRGAVVLRTTSAFNRFAREEIKKLWPKHIWPWVQFIIEEYVVDTSSLPDEDTGTDVMRREDACSETLMLLCVYTSIGDFSFMMGSTAGYLSFITKQWLRGPIFSEKERLWLSVAMCRMVTHPDRGASWTTEVLEVVGDDGLPVIVATCIGDITEFTQRPISGEKLVTGLRPHLAFVEQCALDSAAFARAFLSRGSVKLQMLVLRRLSNPSEDSREAVRRAACMTSSCQYLSRCFKSEGERWIPQALDGRLFEYILRSSDCLLYQVQNGRDDPSEPFLEESYSKILDIIRVYLYCYPVARAVERALHRIDSKASSGSILQQKCPEMWARWQTFRAWVAEEMIPLRSFADTHLYCSNRHCGEKEPNRYLYCGACRNALYCSRLCQKEDWRRHCADCEKEVINRNDGYPNAPTMSIRDWTYLKFKCWHDIKRQEQKIGELVRHFLDSTPHPTPLSLPMITIDYTRWKSGFEPIVSGVNPTLPMWEVKPWDMLLQWITSTGSSGDLLGPGHGLGFLVAITIPRGGQKSILCGAYHLSRESQHGVCPCWAHPPFDSCLAYLEDV